MRAQSSQSSRVTKLRENVEMASLTVSSAPRPATSASQQDSKQELNRYAEVHNRLKKLLESERRQTREVS